jgi:hypothetical protein
VLGGGASLHGQEGQDSQREHGQHRVSVPADPAADLIVVEPDLALRGLKRLLDRPAGSATWMSRCSGRAGRPAQVVGQFAGPWVAAQQDRAVGIGPGLVGLIAIQAQS